MSSVMTQLTDKKVTWFGCINVGVGVDVYCFRLKGSSCMLLIS